MDEAAEGVDTTIKKIGETVAKAADSGRGRTPQVSPCCSPEPINAMLMTNCVCDGLNLV